MHYRFWGLLDSCLAADELLENQGLKVLRFDNRQILLEIDSVLEIIHTVVSERK